MIKIQNNKRFWEFDDSIFNFVSNFVLRISNFNQGFTLVELLVVIGVITLVMVVLFPNLTGARQRARDTQRKSDLAQMQRALELYKSDQNPQVYPTTFSSCGNCWSSGGIGGSCTGNLYMRKLPCDPGNTNPTPYIYTRNASDTLRYTLSACLENQVDPDKDITPVQGCTSAGVSYTVNEP